MSFWNPLSYKTKKIMRNFGDGVNTFYPPMSIKESELTDSVNMCSDDYPDIRTRNDRDIYGTTVSGTMYAIGQRNNTHLHIQEGTNWKYWNTTASAYETISSTMFEKQGVFVEFNTPSARYTILANNDSSGQFPVAYNGTTTLVSLTSDAPHSNLYAVHRNRVFGIDNNGHTLQWCAAGLPTDWATAEDAGSWEINNSKGAATAITSYQDHIIVWTDNSMHELYGTNIYTFNLVDITNEIGCVNFRAWTECRGKLYWMDASGIYVYTGGMPKKISEAVTKWIDGINLTDANKLLICAGNRGDKIFFNIPYASTVNNKVLVFDTYKGKWFVEDGNFSGFTNISDNLLYAFGTTSKQPYIIDSTRKDGVDGSTTAPSTIAWEFITKAYNDYDIDKQNGIKDMWLWYSGTTNATMSIEYSTDMVGSSSTFTELVPSSDIDFSGSAVKLQKPLPVTALQTQDSYRLRFLGTGQVTIHGVQVNQVSWGG